VRLLASGPLLKEAIRAAQLLMDKRGILAEVWSVTSYSELARDGVAAQRELRLGQSERAPYVTSQLGASTAPVVAVSDYVRALPDSIRAFVPSSCVTLGTDGFGRSDTRTRLRDFFEVDRRWIAYTAFGELAAGREPAQRHAFGAELGLDLGKAWSAST